jgi:hypothetical protein
MPGTGTRPGAEPDRLLASWSGQLLAPVRPETERSAGILQIFFVYERRFKRYETFFRNSVDK